MECTLKKSSCLRVPLGHELNYVKAVLFSRCLCTGESGGEYTKGFCVSDMDLLACVDLPIWISRGWGWFVHKRCDMCYCSGP